MSKIKIKILLLLLFPLGMILNNLFELSPYSWERFYSTGINKWFIKCLSNISGILPFSLFEFGIYFFILWIIGYLFYTLIRILKDFSHSPKIIGNFFLTLGAVLAVVYIVFLTFWGLNYKRSHFSEKYGIEIGSYSTEELGDLYQHLVSQANTLRIKLPEDDTGLMLPYGDYRDIFKRAQQGYDVASIEFPTLSGNYGLAKPILSSELMNYTGITGIYSPFTGEPNVNVSVPRATLASTTCHEMAHQRGYGFENECNFIAFITCMSHPDLDFQYSALIMAISYTSNALATTDLTKLQEINETMSEKVFADLAAINQFWDQYEGDIQEMSEQVNNTYLKSNGVKQGTASYGEMVDLLLALYDKYH